MFAATLIAALGALTPPAPPTESPVWHTDYHAARTVAKDLGKPMAVFLGQGSGGPHRLAAEGHLIKEVEQELYRGYVCVHVDTSTEAGSKLASEFDLPSGLGLVLSDRSTDLQAYSHEGTLSNGSILAKLQKYAQASIIVRTTESLAAPQVTVARVAAPPPVAQPISSVPWPPPIPTGYSMGMHAPAPAPSFQSTLALGAPATGRC